MRIDMVKPMPPRMPTPAIMCQLTLRGQLASLELDQGKCHAKNTNRLAQQHAKVHAERHRVGEQRAHIHAYQGEPGAFTNAKIGRITKLTGVEIRRSMRISGGVTRCMTRSTLVVETVKSCWPKMCASSS